MKRSVFYLTVICSLVAGCLLLLSCKDRLDLTDSSHQTVQSYNKTPEQLAKTTTAIYALWAAPGMVGREWFFTHDLRSDEFASGGPFLEANRAHILNGNTLPTNTYMTQFWDSHFAIIHRANTVITSAADIDDNPDLVKKLVGQAKFFRGWAYYDLVTFWGGVPLYTKPVDNPHQFKHRAPKDSVFMQIVQDFKDAASVLPATWDAADKGRITSGAANAMLGRVYMQELKFKKAKAALQKVLNSPADYELVDNYFDNFKLETEFNKETILECVFAKRGGAGSFDWTYTRPNATSPLSTAHSQAYNALTWRNLIPSDKYLANFEWTGYGAAKTDPRLHMSVYVTGDKFNHGNSTLTASEQRGNSSHFHGKTIKVSWRKHSLLYELDPNERPTINMTGLDERMIRLAGIYLDMAECVIETTGNIGGALEWVNKVRNRPSVNMPDYPTAQYPANNKMDVIKIIMHERMAELGGEEKRNLDIKRWIKGGYYKKLGGDPLAIGGPQGKNPLTTYGKSTYLPIPSEEINNNPELGSGSVPAQNPNY
jgi:hypothetical protein